MFYAYVHARPNVENTSGIFYVGKGSVGRASSMKSRNSYHKNVVQKYGKDAILVGKLECSTEETSFELERGLIKCLRRMGVPLTNMTGGGEGVSNPSPAIRAKISASLTGKKATAETRAKLSAAQKKRMSNPFEREKSKSFLGKKHSKGSIAKMSSSKKGSTFTVEHRARLSAAKKGVKLSSEHAKKVGSANLGIKRPQEVRSKISATWRDDAHRALASDRTKGKVWANNGAVTIRVLPDAIPYGFVRGRLPLKLKSKSE